MIRCGVLRDFHVIGLTMMVKRAPFLGSEAQIDTWRATNELKAGVWVMERDGGGGVLVYARACSSKGLSPLEYSSEGLRSA